MTGLLGVVKDPRVPYAHMRSYVAEPGVDPRGELIEVWLATQNTAAEPGNI